MCVVVTCLDTWRVKKWEGVDRIRSGFNEHDTSGLDACLPVDDYVFNDTRFLSVLGVRMRQKTKVMNSRYDDRFETCWCCNNYLEGIQGLDLEVAMALRTLSMLPMSTVLLFDCVFFFDVFFFYLNVVYTSSV